jgi:hypothetical protein
MKVLVIACFILAILFILPNRVGALTVSPPRWEISGERGQTINGELELFNEEKEAKTFYSSFAAFEAAGETGAPRFFPAAEGLATWIKVPTQITLDPQERKVIPFSIQIPQNADPGGHFAAIFWGTSPPKTQEGGQVTIGAKTGILVLLTIPGGEVKAGGGLLEFRTVGKQKTFTFLPITFIYRFQNVSTDRIKPEGEIKIKNILGMTSVTLPANKKEGNVLPNSIRKFEVIWETLNNAKVEETLNNAKKIGFFEAVKKEWSDFHFGPYKANLRLQYGAKNEEAKASFLFFIIPWQLLIIIIIVLIFVLITGWFGIKKYNRWIIAKALKGKKISE